MWKKILYKIFSLILLVFFVISSFWSAIQLTIPYDGGQQDLYSEAGSVVQGNESTIFTTIQLINQYLWFSLAFVFFIILIIGSIKLITSNWDKKHLTGAIKMLAGGSIGVVIAMVSYTIVKLLTNLF